MTALKSNTWEDAIPAASTACLFLLAWLQPLWLGADILKTVLIIMLMEFFTIHASMVLLGFEFAKQVGRDLPKSYLYWVFGAYALFGLGFSAALWSAWPLLLMAWLLISKAWPLFRADKSSPNLKTKQLAIWVISCIAYLAGAAITSIFPMPELGMDTAARAVVKISGSGLWLEQPQTLLAFGLLYFSAIASLHWRWNDRWLSFGKHIRFD